MIKGKLKAVKSDAVWQKIYKISQLFPTGYAAGVAVIAFLGYAYLLLFPLLLIAGIWQIVTFPLQDHVAGSEVTFILFWAGITALAGSVTAHLIKLRFQKIEGIAVDPHMANKLYRLLDKINVQMSVPHIDRIVVTEQLSLDLVKTPVVSFPVWSSNTLVIGLPLMQCLSPEYFECAVTRKLLQYSKQHHWFIKWLYQLRMAWTLHLQAASANVTFNNFLLLLFFRAYAPFYRRVSTPVAHRCELEADKDTLELINDEDLLQTIETVIVTKIFLDQQYWPKIEKMLLDNSLQRIQPYTKLEDILKGGLNTKNTKRWLDTIYTHEPRRINAVPGLRDRMQNIGRSRIRIPEKITESAAHYYLDKNYPSIVAGINRMWQQRCNRPNTSSAGSAATQNVTTIPGAPGGSSTHLSGNLFH
ncbi:MAG: hypothetical protein PVJ39_01745 [Gammaproteobacteria bacterium]|jgi:hypothetical protein